MALSCRPRPVDFLSCRPRRVELANSTTRHPDNSATRQLDNSTTRQLDNSTTRQLDNSRTRELDNSRTRELENSTTRQLDNPLRKTLSGTTSTQAPETGTHHDRGHFGWPGPPPRKMGFLTPENPEQTNGENIPFTKGGKMGFCPPFRASMTIELTRPWPRIHG